MMEKLQPLEKSICKTVSDTADAVLVSVIVPCYNAEKFIGQTIESVLAQSFVNFELIIVDDQSIDNTKKIICGYAQLDKRIRLVSMPQNAGAPAAPRNKGVAVARGVWIAFLDADDLWHPRKLEIQIAAINTSGASMCSTRMKDFFTNSEIIMIDVPSKPRVKQISFVQQLLKYRTPTSSILIRRTLMIECPFNEDKSYKAREDTDCFTRIHEYIPFSIKIDIPLVYYRQQADQISGNKFRMIGRHFSMLKKYRLRSGSGLGVMAYFYTFTHFTVSIYVRWFRRTL